MKTLCLPSDLLKQLERNCAAGYPREACGLLIGHQVVAGEYRVTAVVPSPNLSDQPEKAFEIDPALIIHHQKQARLGRDEIIGHYHSHPDGRAAPSVHDRRQNYDVKLIWLIAGVSEAGCLDLMAYATPESSGQLEEILLTSS